jgi:hypothetical protein
MGSLKFILAFSSTKFGLGSLAFVLAFSSTKFPLISSLR